MLVTLGQSEPVCSMVKWAAEYKGGRETLLKGQSLSLHRKTTNKSYDAILLD